MTVDSVPSSGIPLDQSEILFIKDDNFIGQSQLYNDIISLGYSADVKLPEDISLEILNRYSLVVFSAGSNPDACRSMNMRLALQSFILKSAGKVIIEGGHNGYISAVFPYYLGFRNKVIMIDDWVADNGGNLLISGSQVQSNLANNPNILPAAININFVNNYYQDVCTNNKFTELFYKTANYSDKVGILVSPSVSNPRVINYFFYYSAIADNTDAKKLLENSIYNLIGKPLEINSSSDMIPENFSLFQNYPNPFNPETVISYSVSKSSIISIKIFDVLGNEIAEPVNENKYPGMYEIKWDAENYSNGVYFYSFYVNGKLFDTKKMLLLK